MKELDRVKEIERSIVKKYHKEIWTNFVKAVKEYELIKEGDRIAVCISGGKDSFLLAKLMQELKRHRKFEYELKFIVMDPGYNSENRKLIEENAKLLDIPIEIFNSEIFDVVVDIEKSPCYLCARMRRGHLYSKAKELGCNKIALGHHFDDAIETVLMGMFYAGKYETMMPKLHSRNFEGMELIRPMYMIREDYIKAWVNYNGLRFLRCACRFTEEQEKLGDEGTSKRTEMKELVKEMSKINPSVSTNIFNSMSHVNLETVIAYKYGGKKYSFLDEYDRIGKNIEKRD
ncbi:MAG: tRNA 2-thiocytidine biosynthesis TtcA family protein [Catonella sp.]|uniref:tRNA 2-thiocytidine biosynthesis TtcA family protein n=1 Tax=Catonella sp. TaxID=2382125 RepID=UPI003F9F769C